MLKTDGLSFFFFLTVFFLRALLFFYLPVMWRNPNDATREAGDLKVEGPRKTRGPVRSSGKGCEGTRLKA